ncbi:MAG TPA: adenosylcobinamide-GDP ribazoletransferase [Stellaceae bacterium]|nr:adenosylcobinamide-GDP ribazoletransferase [Stellaceae bacterium]
MDEAPIRRAPGDWPDDLLIAAAFLTRMPIPTPAVLPGRLAQASWAFPLVGVGVGLLGGLAYAFAAWLGLPTLAAALIAVAGTAALTGALHEDGLADTADGFGGGATPEAKLSIMRDSRSGAYGVLALIFSVALRAAAIAAVGDGARVTGALVAAHAVGRGGLPLVLRALNAARADGLGADCGRPEAVIAWTAAAIAGIVALLALGFAPGVGALICAAAVMALLAVLAHRQIGGYTGDVLGAIEQGGEIVMVLTASSWLM